MLIISLSSPLRSARLCHNLVLLLLDVLTEYAGPSLKAELSEASQVSLAAWQLSCSPPAAIPRSIR
jgi:hypothetical protein